MNGAVAAGSKITAEAGAGMLRAGGNAVDAAVAACFATAAGEPVLTSLAGGGAMLVRGAASGEVTVCDFFADAPGLGGRAPEGLDFFPAELDFGSATQAFHIGAGAAAVPGVIPGLCQALERWGRLSLAEVAAPACRLLRAGVPLEPLQAHFFQVLRPILLHTAAGRRQFGRDGQLLAAGDCYRVPQLAELLEELARGPWRQVYDRCLGEPALGQFGPAAGGLLGREDWDAYRVAFRRPLRVDYRGTTLHTNPPPAAGGALVALMLSLLEGEDGAVLCRRDPERVHALCRAMRVADESRRDGAEALGLDAWQERFRDLAGRPLGRVRSPRGGPPDTTHISVVDGDGNAAAVTFSYGEGNGHLLGDTGIMMNNLMGEADLFPQGFHRWPPGRRLSTMMSPSLLERPDGSLVVLGSGGANRIRTAVTQVVCRLVDCGDVPAAAVAAPRVHFEAGVLHAETRGWPSGSAFLAELGAAEFLAFPEPNLFFGGVHVVERAADGSVRGAGDPRRGGACVVV
ncbi:MAG: gamma-glutamyltransferase [Deferrisomatales bacterium]|nr:gamma-glutamyltransferase [Deferrisomatales bacterium]